MTSEANRILDHLAAFPADAKTTTDRKTARDILLGTDGWIMARGHMWDVRTKNRGVGIYEVWLEQRP